uniref:Uncharacterized protein n=1 Tax=Trichobilharzia regenti TaxID=157069 RepID=A0AA85JFS6_TRIRE|nr:unnamed protein product [Trichobilharzia regenti]
MKITNQQQKQQHPTSITINGRDLKEVTSFTYLGSIVSTTGVGTDEDVKSSENREGEKHIHQPEINLEIFVTQPASTTKFGRIFNTNVKSVSSSIRIRNLAGGSQRIFPKGCRPLLTTVFAQY